MASPDWPRLAAFVRDGRAALGYTSRPAFAQAAGISPRSLDSLERGQQVGERVLLAVQRQLGWATGSCQEILRGGVPVSREELAQLGTVEAIATAIQRVDQPAARARLESHLRAFLAGSAAPLVFLPPAGEPPADGSSQSA